MRAVLPQVGIVARASLPDFPSAISRPRQCSGKAVDVCGPGTGDAQVNVNVIHAARPHALPGQNSKGQRRHDSAKCSRMGTRKQHDQSLMFLLKFYGTHAMPKAWSEESPRKMILVGAEVMFMHDNGLMITHAKA
jgi:hypothetical protein